MLPVYKETYLSETLTILVADIRIERLLHHMRVTWYSNPPYLRCLAGQARLELATCALTVRRSAN